MLLIRVKSLNYDIFCKTNVLYDIRKMVGVKTQTSFLHVFINKQFKKRNNTYYLAFGPKWQAKFFFD